MADPYGELFRDRKEPHLSAPSTAPMPASGTPPPRPTSRWKTLAFGLMTFVIVWIVVGFFLGQYDPALRKYQFTYFLGHISGVREGAHAEAATKDLAAREAAIAAAQRDAEATKVITVARETAPITVEVYSKNKDSDVRAAGEIAVIDVEKKRKLAAIETKQAGDMVAEKAVPECLKRAQLDAIKAINECSGQKVPGAVCDFRYRQIMELAENNCAKLLNRPSLGRTAATR